MIRRIYVACVPTRLRMLMWIPLYPFYLVWLAGYHLRLWGKRYDG